MKGFSKVGLTWLKVMPMLFLLALTACSGPQRTIVLPEAQTASIRKGDPAPFDGWLVTSGAMAIILEAEERCQGVR